MPTPFISELTFDNKSTSGARTVTLGPKTLIVGPNEGHKSAIVEAILYYLYGGMPDVMNRRNPSKAKHIIGDITADGKLPHIQMKVGGRDMVGNELVLSRPEHPYLEAYMAFSGTAKSAQEYLLTYFDSGVDWSGHMDKSLFNDPANLPGRIFTTQLLDAIQSQSATIAKLKSEIQVIQEVIEQLEREINDINSLIDNMPIEFIFPQVERLMIKNIILSIKPEQRAEAKEHIKWIIQHAMQTDISTVMGTKDNVITDWALAFQRTAKQQRCSNLLTELSFNQAYLVQQEGRLKLLGIPYDMAVKEASNLAIDYINAQLAPHDKIAIDPTKGLIGVYRPDGHGHPIPHWSMSGSVQARVIGALAAASATDDTLSVVALPDRAWDEAHLVKTMEMLQGFNAQILICNTYKPKKVPKTWTVLEVK